MYILLIPAYSAEALSIARSVGLAYASHKLTSTHTYVSDLILKLKRPLSYVSSTDQNVIFPLLEFTN